MNPNLIKRYRSMPFMLRYADLFHRSNAITNIIPREIATAEELQDQYPMLLTEASS
jgi:hypothetical protein